MAGYVNVPPMIGSVVNSKLASLYELQSIYGTEDLFDLYEVILIKIANEQKIMDRIREKRKR